MLGLAENKIKLVPYDPQWPRDYEKEKASILASLGNIVLDIEHTGSTSVPGLQAKPIIDIMVAVKDIPEIQALEMEVESIGYRPTDLVQAESHVVFSKGDPVTHHIHFVQCQSLKGTSHPVFRDKLRRDMVLAGEYVDLKRRLATEFADNRLPMPLKKESGFKR